MAPTATHGSSSQLLVVSDKGGVTVVNPSTPLKRLNYFDGRFLRADDFDVEQEYLRHLVALSNQGLGPGVVYGYDTTLGSGDNIDIGPGLAVDPSGNVLLLQSAISQSIQALIDASKRSAMPSGPAAPATGTGAFSDCVEIAAPPPTTVVPVSDIYVIAICAAEALCGQSDVFGKLCEEACVTSTDRPYRLDGVVLRAIPLQLVTPFPTSRVVPIGANAYLRSKVAHSWYADERRKHPDAIARAGLLSGVWCLGSGYDSACCEVPLAVVARAGSTTVFLDSWIVRRERMDAPARRYWQWKMRMRPWDVFLAQILQFQCQLADLLSGAVTPGSRAADPCESHQQTLHEAAEFVTQVRAGLASFRTVASDATFDSRPALLSLSLSQVSDLQQRIRRVIGSGPTLRHRDRILIRSGIIELPPAGYLPVVTGSDVTVNDQVRALLGDGLDLRFCVTTADYIAHAVEEAQHMDRISLLQGLDDPTDQPHVDILVPDGTIVMSGRSKADLYDASLAFSAEQTGGLRYRGTAREEHQPSGATALSMAAAGLSQTAVSRIQQLVRAFTSTRSDAKPAAVTADFSKNAFVMNPQTTETRADNMVINAASTARMFAAGPVAAATRKRILASNARAVAADGAVDGMWLTTRTERDLRTLAVDEHTPLSFRVVIGSRPASPVAVELTFTGTLSISAVATGPVLTGTLNGILAMGLLKENQAEQQTTEYLSTERFNWPARLTYAGEPNNGSVSLDLRMGATSKAPSDTNAGLHLRLTKTFAGSGSPITYEAAVLQRAANVPSGTLTSVAPAAGTVVPLGRLRLVPDADIVNSSNLFHQYAESGLDIVQAALVVSEPHLKTSAEAILFPAPPTATKDLTIEAVRDWVMFTRRREVRCARAIVPPPPASPRIYRVIEITGKDADEARKIAAQLAADVRDPAKLTTTIQNLLERQDRENAVKLFVKFAGGKATAETDLVAAESDWATFTPGATIVYAAIGAAQETDAALQLRRLGTFEAAISVHSRPDAATKTDTIIPFPQTAVPANADGVMLFVTVSAQVVERHALLIYGNWDRMGAGVGNHFLQPAAAGGPPSPSSPMDFADNVPQGNALATFIANLTANQPVLGVTLATTKAAPDAGAPARLQAVLDALVAAGRPMPAATRRVVEAINDHDRAEVTRVGHTPNDFDEVIFFELNAGA